jgi:hypothetical protein
VAVKDKEPSTNEVESETEPVSQVDQEADSLEGRDIVVTESGSINVVVDLPPTPV